MRKSSLIYNLLFAGITLLFFSCEMKDELKNSNSSEENTASIFLNLDIDTRSIGTSVDVKDFSVQIVDEQDVIVKYIPKYGELSDAERYIELPLGSYRILAASYAGEMEEASLQPYYLGEQSVVLKENGQQNIAIVCALGSAMVAVEYEDEFLEAVQPDITLILTNGKGIITLENGDTRPVYFKESDFIKITVRATTLEGEQITNTSTFRNSNNSASAGDKFEVLIKLEEITDPGTEEPDPGPNPGGPDPEEPEPGKAKFQIVIKVTLNGREIFVTIPRPDEGDENGGEEPGGPDEPGGPEEPDPNKGNPSITGAETYIYNLAGEAKDMWMEDVKVYLTVPNGLKHLYVKIDSTNDSFMNDPVLKPLISFDLVNPGELIDILVELELLDSTNSIEGYTSFMFDITTFVGLLIGFNTDGLGDVHSFDLELVDLLGLSVKETLKIQVVPSF